MATRGVRNRTTTGLGPIESQRLRKRVTIDKDSKTHPSAERSRSLSVLVLTSERSSNDALLRQVLPEDHAAGNALDGFSTVRVDASQLADVVLLDMDIATLDGCHLARRLRSDCLSKDGLIIALTAQVNDDRRRECTRAGINLLLPKPIDREIIDTLLMLECIRVNRRLQDADEQWQFEMEPFDIGQLALTPRAIRNRTTEYPC